ncbi:HK97 family phage prohead protease [Frankia sp. Cr1]|uniref:HK97 family phage prohead protease n=1 Tax=Frankia sp. Cr1 TaxID=3073931 RepID=UPI002AD4C36D|nr:HK97 family phage prohead protease [Frankia sp. Cr1]
MDAPRERIERMLPVSRAVLRDTGDGGDGPGRLVGHFAVFNQLTEIHSWWEGDFREQIAAGSFLRTFGQRADQIRCIYEHGRDAMFGRKPLGPPDVLKEDTRGAWYEVPLFDNELNRDYLVPAARAGQLSASFSFDVLKETWEEEPADGGLPIRTIQEVRLYEFGPCPFPAYADATAGMRAEAWDHLPDLTRAKLGEHLAEHLARSLTAALPTEVRAELARLIVPGTPEVGPGPATPPSGSAFSSVDPAYDHSTTSPATPPVSAADRRAFRDAITWS